MKFNILTPAILAALATSASAAYQSTDTESCEYYPNLFICAQVTDQTTCEANAECLWTEGICTINLADYTKDYSDDTIAQNALSSHTACTSKQSESDCTGDCAWANTWDDQTNQAQATCIPNLAKSADLLSDAPKGIKAKKLVDVFAYINCVGSDDQATCEAVDGCNWDATDSPKCDAAQTKFFDDVKAACGSDGDWDAAAAATGISGAADSASRFAVLAASAVAAASLLA